MRRSDKYILLLVARSILENSKQWHQRYQLQFQFYSTTN